MDFIRWIKGTDDPISRAIDDAIDQMKDKDFDGAIHTLHERALSRNPEHRRALLHLGVAHMLRGDTEEAETLLAPIAGQRERDSESAAAQIALEKIARERKASQ